MGFRDQSQAQRAHIEALEGELSAAEDEISQLESDREELPKLREQVAELQRELNRYRPGPSSRARPKARRVRRMLVVAAAVAVGGGVAAINSEILRRDSLPPSLGDLDLDLSPRPPEFSGSVQAARPADSIAEGCPGYIPQEPTLRLRTRARREVRIWADSEVDLVLVVRAANGDLFCDDDSGRGTNPRLLAELGPGSHEVFVGVFGSPSMAPFTLEVDGLTLEESGSFDAAAGQIAPLALGARWQRTGTAEGAVRAELARAGCPGLVPSHPQFELDVRSAGTLELNAIGGDDPVMLVRRPDGTFSCDDDSAGDLNPAIVETAQPGAYRVWVGTYEPRAEAPFTFSASLSTVAPPVSSARLGRWQLSGGGSVSFSERVTGTQTLGERSPGEASAPAECAALYGGAVPDVELAVDDNNTVTLSVRSERPLGFWVEHPDGSVSCHASGHAERAVWRPGVHRIWIGARQPDAGISFSLTAETEPP